MRSTRLQLRVQRKVSVTLTPASSKNETALTAGIMAAVPHRSGIKMSSLTKKTKPDRSKIDAQNAKELKYWTKALGVSKETLLQAIEKVGNAAATVRKELGNAKPHQPDFPMSAEGKKIIKQDGTPVAETANPAVAAERLSEDEARREEDNWSA